MNRQGHLCRECHPSCRWLRTQHNPTHPVPTYLQSRHLPSGTINVPGHLPHGLFHDHRHDLFCVYVPAWGIWAENLAWALWIIDAAISSVCALSLPFLLYVDTRVYFTSLSCELTGRYTACHLKKIPIFHP